MTRAVIDTNVWVSGLLSPGGAPAHIIDRVIDGLVVPVLSPAIMAEYEDVLLRLELSLRAADVRVVLRYLQLPGPHVGHVDPPDIERVCADPDDDIFMTAAVAGDAAYLITGNLRHFPKSPWRGVRIVTPNGFLVLARLSQ